jgi:hypothetical protein
MFFQLLLNLALVHFERCEQPCNMPVWTERIKE